ncbi:hypothetical protein GDO81_023441 [Engystomops pustulosus]|uniref:Uncharacterized protein n=1 Tax=Engystomops pustulosus TaxID=76066 RepID=A0AAV6Z475_ENGPU|nr:hypothetical protein GDO81_023441 [Engystomops pustulosus]
MGSKSFLVTPLVTSVVNGVHQMPMMSYWALGSIIKMCSITMYCQNTYLQQLAALPKSERDTMGSMASVCRLELQMVEGLRVVGLSWRKPW